MTLPTGFLPNQAQFGGSGIAISGLTSAKMSQYVSISQYIGIPGME